MSRKQNPWRMRSCAYCGKVIGSKEYYHIGGNQSPVIHHECVIHYMPQIAVQRDSKMLRGLPLQWAFWRTKKLLIGQTVFGNMMYSVSVRLAPPTNPDGTLKLYQPPSQDIFTGRDELDLPRPHPLLFWNWDWSASVVDWRNQCYLHGVPNVGSAWIPPGLDGLAYDTQIQVWNDETRHVSHGHHIRMYRRNHEFAIEAGQFSPGGDTRIGQQFSHIKHSGPPEPVVREQRKVKINDNR